VSEKYLTQHMLYVLIFILNISQLLSNERYIGAKMDTAGPSSLENSNWEDELDACSDSDASWGDEDDLDRESIASSLGSNDDAFFNDPETVEVELQLGQMFIRIAEWKEQLEERQWRPIPQRTSELTGPM
jgi:hypothetical protein